MSVTRRKLLKSAAAVSALAASGQVFTGQVFAPAIAQNKPLRIGILAPRSGVAAGPGENGIRASQWTMEKFNAAGGIGGRKIELVIEEESSPKDTIERFSKLVQQEKVDCTMGIISTGVGLALGPVVEESARPDDLLGRHHPGRRGGSCEPEIPVPLLRQRMQAIIASLLCDQVLEGPVRHRGRQSRLFLRPQQHGGVHALLLQRFKIEHKVVTEQWVKVGSLERRARSPRSRRQAGPDLLTRCCSPTCRCS